MRVAPVVRSVSEWRIRKRNRLKRKPAIALRDRISAEFGGVALWDEEAAVEIGSLPGYDVIVVDNQVHGIIQDDQPFLSVRGLLVYRPDVRFVTVDMGAVRFVHNGADIMAPGIVDADPALHVGDWCWVRDEKNGQPLAVGRCLMEGAEMGPADAGKAVASVHFLGDKLWELDA